MLNKCGYLSLLDHPRLDAELGGIIGLLVGDACGRPYEFHAPESLPNRHLIDMTPPVGFPATYPKVPAGTWSDDGAQAMCLLASLLEKGRFSLVDFSDRLLRWLDHGYMAVDGYVFDVGNQTDEALSNLRDGVPPTESGGRDEWSNGNGALMRVLPLALWHSGGDEELAKDAHLSSLPTHAHSRSLVVCAYYCLVARSYLAGRSDAWEGADQRLEDIYSLWPDRQERSAFLTELEVLRNFPRSNQSRGTGYVLDTIWSSREALEEDSFEKVVQTAIRFGSDTDTTAAVAGGLAGIRFGLSSIPERWLKQLRGWEWVEPLIPAFLSRMAVVR